MDDGSQSTEPDNASPGESADTTDRTSAPGGLAGWWSRHAAARMRWSVLFLALGIVAAPLALTAGWARNLAVSDTAYVDAVGPLATDPAVQNAIVDRVSTATMDAIDNLGVSAQIKAQLTEWGVPPKLTAAAGTALSALNAGLGDLVTRLVNTIVTAPAFAKVWTGLNQDLHHAFVAAMNGDSLLLDPQGGLSLRIEPIAAQVKQQLIDRGYDWAKLIPAIGANREGIQILSAQDVSTMRTYYNDLNTLSIILWILAPVFLVISILLGLPRWLRGIRRAALGVAIAVLVLGGLVRVAENLIIGHLENAPHPDAIRAILDSVTAGLRSSIRWTFIGGAVIAVVVMLVDRDLTGQRVRAALASAWQFIRTPPNITLQRTVFGGIAVVCGLIVAFVGGMPTTLLAVLLILMLVSAVLAIIPRQALALPRERARPPVPAVDPRG